MRQMSGEYCGYWGRHKKLPPVRSTAGRWSANPCSRTCGSLPSARTRSARPRRCSASTPTCTSQSPRTSCPCPGGHRPRPRGSTPSGSRSTTRGQRPTRLASELHERMKNRTLPDGWADALPTWPAEKDGKPNAVSTRKASGEVLTALAPRAARAVGRFGRPRREQQHDDGGRAELHPGRAPDQDVAGRPVRPHPALRHPRARDGRDHQRHHAARRHPRLRRHVPGVQRLHAPAGAAGRADAAAVDLRVDPRLDRPRRRRPDPPADRAPRRAAGDPRPGRGPARRRERDRRRAGGRSWRRPTAGRHRLVPAEPAGARPGQGRPTPARAATSSKRPRPAGQR